MSDDLTSDSGWPDPIYRLPRLWWHFIIPVLVAIFWFLIAAAAEWRLIQPGNSTFKDRGGVERTVTRAERWPYIALWGVLLVTAPLLPISYAVTSPLVIRKHGLELGLRDRKGQTLGLIGPIAFQWFAIMRQSGSRLRRWEFRITPWELVGPCYWGRYNPGTLTIPSPNGLLLFPIPEPDRAEVEAAFRHFGKWRD